MDDRAARLFGQLAHCDQGGHRARRDRLAPLVHHEAAVGVAVEGQAGVRAHLAHLGLQVHQVLRVQRVGLVVGEVAVQLEVQRHDLDGQVGEDRGHGVPAHAVAGVHDHLQRPAAGQVDQIAQVGGVLGEHVPLGDAARGGVLGVGHALFHVGADVGEAALQAHRGGAGPAQLDAVVLGGVVAGGEHRAGQVELARGEVELVGAGQADGDHVNALPGDAVGERRGQFRGGVPHVVSDDHGGAADQPGEGRTGPPDQIGVELFAHDATDVICLEHAGQVAHTFSRVSRQRSVGAVRCSLDGSR